LSAIAGLIHLDGQIPDRSTVERMQSVLTPYGRDARNQFHLGNSAFTRTLLRTTPEDSLDRQPLHHRASDSVLVFDGRIDNREEISKKLGISANDARMLADSDLVLQACLRWQHDCVHHLLGDYALAYWNFRNRCLWLARDPMGGRPLYWHRKPGLFAFSTMPKGLFAIPEVPREICQSTLHDYLCHIPMAGNASFYKDIQRVEPGQLLMLNGNRLDSRHYHRLEDTREIRLRSDHEYVEALGEQLERSVACRLRAGGPIASQLSSGLDSSTVTATAARLLNDHGRSLLAYTAVPREGFEGPVPRHWHADEGPGASALVARHPNIEHHLIRTGGTSPIENLESSIEALDRPPLNLCNQTWCNAIEADAVKRGARVLLVGNKGNASISYSGLPYLSRLLTSGRWWRWWRELNALCHHSRRFSGRLLLLQSIGPYLPPGLWKRFAKRSGMYWNLSDYCPAHPEFLHTMRQRRKIKRDHWDPYFRPWANGRKMRVSMLTRGDNADYAAASNVAGLEVRDPTADLRLVEFCLSVPEEQFLRNGQTRWLLKRLMHDVLPDKILHSQSKGYQAADWYEALGSDLPQVDELIDDLCRDGVDQFVDLKRLSDTLDHWPEGKWTQPGSNERRYRIKLLRGLSVGAFIQKTEASNR